MAGEEEVVDPNAAVADDPDTDAEAAALAVDMGGNKMVPLSALIAAKKEGKGYRDKVKELEPIAANATTVGEQLGRAQPIIQAILSNPKLRAEAMRIANGTRASADTTDQPDASEDPDASAYAEDAGFYLADGQTPDVARARRVLTRLDARHGKQTDDRMRPLASITLDQRSQANLRAAEAATDSDGETPLATAESIREVASQLPSHLLADPKVVDLVLNSAIGLDRRKNRTPKPSSEPLFLERNGGSRGREAVLSSDERKFLKNSGVDEKTYRANAEKLATGKAITFEEN